MNLPVTGRCFCGATRYRIDAPVLFQVHCHCESCRRATGAAMASWLGARMDAFHWLTQPPLTHTSSPGRHWDRCATCGSPLAYRTSRFPDEIHLHAATLDAPETFIPEEHVHWDEHLPWLHLADRLPRT